MFRARARWNTGRRGCPSRTHRLGVYGPVPVMSSRVKVGRAQVFRGRLERAGESGTIGGWGPLAVWAR